MAKRNSSGFSRLIGINKPIGMSSHDVVNRVRRIFNERRVGHAGTLDPLASGVLLVCVGPATRLDAFLVGHGKRYKMGVTFGISTTTDDSEGEILKEIPYSEQLQESNFAHTFVHNMVGKGTQIPPVYSAIKVNGKKRINKHVVAKLLIYVRAHLKFMTLNCFRLAMLKELMVSRQQSGFAK